MRLSITILFDIILLQKYAWPNPTALCTNQRLSSRGSMERSKICIGYLLFMFSLYQFNKITFSKYLLKLPSNSGPIWTSKGFIPFNLYEFQSIHIDDLSYFGSGVTSDFRHASIMDTEIAKPTIPRDLKP